MIYFIHKYGFLIFSAIWITAYLYFSLTPNTEITVNGKLEQSDFINSVPFLLFGFLFSIPYFLYGRKMVYVEMNDEIIRIRKNGKTKDYTWNQVDRLGLSYVIIPPTYRMKIKSQNATYFFCSGMNGFSVPFRVWDFSKMGKFIKKKKVEYNLEY